jgi:SAM-dependent methyltransferase
MSSWVSHLPAELAFARVAGLGMNRDELAANPRLSDFCVHDLNARPELPYSDASFDAVLNAVSIQYLVHPVAVLAEVRRVLRPGGISIVAMSHRCFPTKAVRAFHVLPRDGSSSWWRPITRSQRASRRRLDHRRPVGDPSDRRRAAPADPTTAAQRAEASEGHRMRSSRADRGSAAEAAQIFHASRGIH